MDASGFAVRMTGVSKRYLLGKVEVEALRSVTLSLPARRFNVVIGPSGSGKTTLLNLIGCIDVPTSGRVEVCGREVAGLSDDAASDFRAKHIGFIFQSFNLIPILSAYENVEYPLLLTKTPSKDRKERVLRMLEDVGLADHRRHRPNELSGGQRQRVAIARALVNEPELVLADEPTANLDSRTGRSIVDLMHAMQERNDITFIFSSHDTEIMDRAHAIFEIRDGRLVAGDEEAGRKGERRGP